ncbi:MAG TPA: DUF2235 domain-containing protein [Thermoanaerobaculia bacterium]|jgi:uncharacterized protein (DUF2235 family)|nr:DUF2235 domain-containing protein [Thermoanaerobaculia bacterium]
METTSTAAPHTPRRIVLCLDGTWNGAFDESKRRDGHTVLKPTNTLKMARAVVPIGADGIEQIVYYAIGVGSLAVYPGTANAILHQVDRLLGGAFGAKFEANVEDALHFLTLNYLPGDEVFVFGFSRGAGTARAVTRFLQWNHGLPQKSDAYYLPLLFREYLRVKGGEKNNEFQNAIDKINAQRAEEKPRPKPPLDPFVPVTVKYLGVWDTVMALGSRLNATGAETSAHDRAFFAGAEPATCVRRARQALAIDERRFDFRPEVWTNALPDQQVEQRWFAGVHSNVGGGYVHDGLANVTFRWILDGAIESKLEIDPDFIKFYRPFFGDSLYESSTPFYKVLDLVRSTMGRGGRELHGYHADLSPSVIDRMCADPSKLRDKDDNPARTPYRPQNVIRFLAAQPDLDAYLQQIGVTGNPLPQDVLAQIQQLRAASAAAALPGAAPA